MSKKKRVRRVRRVKSTAFGEYQDQALGVTQASVVMGVGSGVVAGVGGPTAAGGQAALATFSGFMPVTSQVAAGGITIRELQKMGGKKKKKGVLR